MCFLLSLGLYEFICISVCLGWGGFKGNMEDKQTDSRTVEGSALIARLRLTLPWFICLCHWDKHHSNPLTRKMNRPEDEHSVLWAENHSHVYVYMVWCKSAPTNTQTPSILHAHTFLHAFPGPCNEETSVRAVSQRRSPWKWLELVTKTLKSFSQGKGKAHREKQQERRQEQTARALPGDTLTLARQRDWLTERVRRHADEDGLKGCDGQMRQKHIEIKRLGGRVEEELAKRREKLVGRVEGKQILNTIRHLTRPHLTLLQTPSSLTYTEYKVCTQIFTLHRYTTLLHIFPVNLRD